MNTKEIMLGLALGVLAALLVTGCVEESAPPIVVQPVPSGYEITTTGSGCRETATGQYVDRAKCDANAE